MYEIKIKPENHTILFKPSGRIDSNTAPQFQKDVFDNLNDSVKEIHFDFTNLDYISSAGLRVFLSLRKKVGAPIPMKAYHVNSSIQEVFELTGFSDIITVVNTVSEDKPNIKAIFFDVDGTLLSHRTGKVPQSTIDAIHEVQQNGIKAIICTGRILSELEGLPVMQIPFDGYLTLNGNLCFDEKKQFFAGNEIAPAEVEILVRIFKASKIPFVLNGIENRYINYVDDVVINTQAITKGTIPDIGEYHGEKIYQCLAFVADKERLMLEDMLDECSITSWNDTGIDIISKHGGKAQGIEKFINHYHLRRGETMAFGDGQNDMEMLRYADIGVAMGNAGDAVKKAADYVTSDIDEDGIANALRHFQLIK